MKQQFCLFVAALAFSCTNAFAAPAQPPMSKKDKEEMAKICGEIKKNPKFLEEMKKDSEKKPAKKLKIKPEDMKEFCKSIEKKK